MSIRYKHLLSPVQVGNVLFKNRMEATAATPTSSRAPNLIPRRSGSP